ncbi:hypothetical protein Daus18300_005760 [Diaporthe australafricana]|uniref:RNA ligase domain-containing protein n=1 Tax=Diaporthe australafricana TaxID=127596 RepID=A0ABR3X011_9PEZI
MDPAPNNPPSAVIAPALVRKLVTIRRITQIRQTGSSSRQRVVTVDGGWNVVTINEFKVDEHILFFETDSFIPTTLVSFDWDFDDQLDDFEGQRGYHVRSQMVGNNLSQGLILPISSMPRVRQTLGTLMDEFGNAEGLRLAKEMAFEGELGVKKWEAPRLQNSDGSLILGRAPVFIRQPGCPRIQDKPQMLAEEYHNAIFEITEKLDGVPMTVYRVQNGSQWDRALPALPAGSSQRTPYGRVGISTRYHDIGEKAGDLYWTAAKDIGLPSKFSQIRLPNVAISGELIGPGMNSSIHFAPGERTQFIVFQMFDIDAQELLDTDVVRALCSRRVLPYVPVLNISKLGEFTTDIDELLSRADGVGFHGQTREGLVFKLLDWPATAFKVISNQWLLENRE